MSDPTGHGTRYVNWTLITHNVPICRLYSIMLLPSGDLSSCQGGGARETKGSIKRPIVMQTYHCVASYDTKDTKNRPFSVRQNEALEVLIKDPKGQRHMSSSSSSFMVCLVSS